ncbi:MAG: site-specific integrase [Phycisphaerales bacterium]
MRYLSAIELEKLLSYVQAQADVARRRGATRAAVDEILILLLVNTGLRASELCNLTIADLVAEYGSGIIKIRNARGNVSRAVEVTSGMTESLLRFIRLYRRQAEPHDPFLVSERGTPFTYMSLYNKVRRIGKHAKIGNLSPRILRATYVIRLFNSEQDLWFVQQQAGHASPRTTAMYALAGGSHNLPVVASDQRDSGTIGRTRRSSRQATTERPTAERATSHEEAVSVKGFQQTEKCEACGRTIRKRGGTRIDSGQILCSSCLEELRKR